MLLVVELESPPIVLRIIGDEVKIAGRRSLAVGSREIRSVKTAVPKLGSSVEFPLWKKRFEGFALPNDCTQAFTTAPNMPVGDSSVTSRFLLDVNSMRQVCKTSPHCMDLLN